MTKRVLMVANVSSMIEQFNMKNIEILQNMGYEVHVAANFELGNTTTNIRANEFRSELISNGIEVIQLPIVRHSGLNKDNFSAYKILKAIIKKNKYSMIHCHSPIGGILTRLAARSERKNGTKVISTSHGFLFCKGAPLKNWLFYYSIERFLARYTDVLITINKEDYTTAQKFKAKKIEYVPGIGVDTVKFDKIAHIRESKRKEFGIKDGTIVILSIGEFIKRKNHETALRAITKLKDKKILYLICGQGELEEHLKNFTKNHDIEDRVRFLGYRNDIAEICTASDIFLFPSYQEGLPVAIMEAMSAGLPIVCSEIRGNTDLIQQGIGGYLIDADNYENFANELSKLIENDDLRKKIGEYNRRHVKDYDIQNISKIMTRIYRENILG